MKIAIVLIAVLAISASALSDVPSTQPSIAWQGWSDDVFQQATKEHKFVILDLEAVWCHWCHVMDETTYKDPEVIRLLGSQYIALKVDQDSRPDLSNRYEDYGWPATVVFGPDGKEIAIRQGYLTPRQMASMLQAIIDDPSPGPSVHAQAEIHTGDSALSEANRKELIRRLNVTYDDQYGSWGTVQKFMDWDSVEYCMSHAKDAQFERMAEGTLAGQLHLVDPVWGGVYQYSTDGDWEHPHFEKIMQMQAENLRLYSYAWAKYKDPRWLKAAEAIHGFLKNFLLAPDGGFYTSMDADLIDGVHSDKYFALDDAGRRAQGVPRVDQHQYSRENGWTINALAALYAATGERSALDEAIKAADWVIANRSIEGGGFRHDETDRAGPYLGDTVSMGRAMLSLYSVTGDRRWLVKADAAGSFIAAHFVAEDIPGVATSDATHGGPFRPRPELDENVMVARFGNLLWNYTGKDAHQKLAQRAMAYLAAPQVALSRGTMVAGILLADQEMSSAPLHVTVVGAKSDSAAKDLLLAAISYPHPYHRIEWFDRAEGPLPHSDVEFPNMPKAAAFICNGSSCSSPAFTPADALAKLRRRDIQ